MTQIINFPNGGRSRERIRVIDGHQGYVRYEKLRDPRAYVTIGPAETHVTVMDDDGVSPRKWTAIFGWSFLFNTPLRIGDRDVRLEEVETIARAMKGTTKIFGEVVDTGAWRQEVSTQLTASLDEILMATIGSGSQYSGIVLAAPEWMHSVLEGSLGIRPHILKSIRDA